MCRSQGLGKRKDPSRRAGPRAAQHRGGAWPALEAVEAEGAGQHRAGQQAGPRGRDLPCLVLQVVVGTLLTRPSDGLSPLFVLEGEC